MLTQKVFPKRRCLAFVVAISTLLWLGANPPTPSDLDTSGLHFLLEWQNPVEEGTRGQGLLVMEQTKSSTISRLLVVPPTDARLVLTYWLDPTAGITHWDLLEELSGWRMSVDLDYGVTAPTLTEYFSKARKRDDPSQTDWFIDIRLQASPDLVLETKQVVRADSVWRQIATAAADERVGQEIVEAIPEELAGALHFLDASLRKPDGSNYRNFETTGFIFRGPVDLLVALMRDEGIGAMPEAPMWDQEVRFEKDLLGPDDLEFVSRFQTVENADPLSDLRIADY